MTTSLFTTGNGVTFHPYAPATSAAKLPPYTFVLKFDQRMGFYLERVDDLPVPDRIYGPCHAERILRTYVGRANGRSGVSTGVWLNGSKGSGKTLLAAILSKQMRETLQLPTILIQSVFGGPSFNSFVEHVGQACFIFDEFEKLFKARGEDREENPQDDLLTLFGGSVVAQHLYIITTNSTEDIHDAMVNRPQRMRYFIDVRGVSEELVREYVASNMNDASLHDEMISALSKVPDCNFDVMAAAIDEHNRFGGDIPELLAIMNIHRDSGMRWLCRAVGIFKYSDDGSNNIKSIEGSASCQWRVDLQDYLQDEGFCHLHMKLAYATSKVVGTNNFNIGISFDAELVQSDELGMSHQVQVQSKEFVGVVTFTPDYGFSKFRQSF